MTARRWAALLCAAAITFVLAGCSADGQTASDAAGPQAGGPAFANVEPDEIIIGFAAGAEALPFVVAEREGLFSDAGVGATIVRFDTAVERDAALVAGDIDAMVAELGVAAGLEAAGTPVAVVSLVADPMGANGPASTPEAGQAPAESGLGVERAYLVVSDYYIAIPSGLLATRAALEASDAAVVRIQAGPATYQEALGGMTPGGSTVAGGAYRPSSAPGVTVVQQFLDALVGARPEIAGVSADDLVLDIGR
ncbi:MAG: hypothetical protein JW733_05085 [Coriobacteriia bacterium]|nr:hypothetical protein [Coriobacteriia bacterium]MBN2847310.1 hypothetical protein [Coriobacteriia bacterium]